MDLFPVYVDGMDYNSATEILGLSRGTLASRLLQGRANCARSGRD
jgi:DNA-directed RNA polymerase specialized sigma24 family protein